MKSKITKNMQKVLLLFVFTITNIHNHVHTLTISADNTTKVTPNYMQLEKEVIEVTLPPSSTPESSSSGASLNDPAAIPIFSESGGGQKSGETKSNVKPRKGVDFNQANGLAPVSSTSYSVQEKVDEPHPDVPIVIDTNTTSKPSNATTKPPKGEVIPVAPPVEKVPKKPEITYSPEDNPEILKSSSEPKKLPVIEQPAPPHIQSIEEPTSAFSKEFGPDEGPGYGSYIGYAVISAIVLIFIALPIVFGRKLKDYWATRHYRRVDFLVDGMYAD